VVVKVGRGGVLWCFVMAVVVTRGGVSTRAVPRYLHSDYVCTTGHAAEHSHSAGELHPHHIDGGATGGHPWCM
jgi:hypothetical protein